ncbi:MAG: hypothetical protein KU29_11590 [Sulfurovum sp. FS06-10]|nr:MAG: hypothetical protein KU29_11590 [Sulfurovum sp. FS06-10]
MNKIIKRNLVLIVFVTMVVVGLLIRYGMGEESWQWKLWGSVDVALAVALGVMAFLGYQEYIKSEDEVKIYFWIDGIEKKDTGLSLLRKDCTRGEILGVLGMIQKDSVGRYDIGYMKNKDFLHALHHTQKSNIKEFVIVVSAVEFKQFEIV